MSQDFEFNDQPLPHEPLTQSPPAPPSSAPPRPTVPPRPPAGRPDPLYRSPLSIGAGLLFVLALAGGIGYLGVDAYKNVEAAPGTEGQLEAPPADGTPAPTPPASAEAPPTATPAAPGAELAAEVEGLKSSLKAATARIDELSAKPAADTKALEDRLAAIEEAQKTLAAVPTKLSALDEKVGTLGKPEPASGDTSAKIDAVDKRVGELSQAIEAVRTEVASLSKPAPQPDQPAQDDAAVDKALAQGADLFLQRKYAESLDVFTKLQADHPDDARVWYFSALANGLTTRDWAGETARLVNKGIEREKAGTPEASKIDAQFSGLTVANGKDWLASYRARASSR